MFQQLGEIAAFGYEETGDHQRLGLAAFRLVLRGLERLIGIVGEAVQVEAVVPVGAADERKSVGTQVVGYVFEADF